MEGSTMRSTRLRVEELASFGRKSSLRRPKRQHQLSLLLLWPKTLMLQLYRCCFPTAGSWSLTTAKTRPSSAHPLVQCLILSRALSLTVVFLLSSPLQWKQGVPLEVAPFAYSTVLLALKKLGSTKCGLRMGKMKAGASLSQARFSEGPEEREPCHLCA